MYNIYILYTRGGLFEVVLKLFNGGGVRAPTPQSKKPLWRTLGPDFDFVRREYNHSMRKLTRRGGIFYSRRGLSREIL